MEFKIRNEDPTDAESKLVDALRKNGKAIISFSVRSLLPHPAIQKGLVSHLWLFVLTANHTESGRNLSKKDCASAKNLDMTIALFLAIRSIIGASGSRKRVTSTYRMSMALMTSLCLSAFPGASWRMAW